MAIDPKEAASRLLNSGLSPQAKQALEVMAEIQKRPVEDVLRDEIRKYLAGRLPAIDIDSAMQALKTTAYQAGYLVGTLRRLTNRED